MKHLKKFEELNKQTYLSAADKLRNKGHDSRAKDLEDHASKIIVSDDELTYYRTIKNYGGGVSKVTNPKLITGKITDMNITKEPYHTYSKPSRTLKDRVFGDNKDDIKTLEYYELFLDIKFSNGDNFKLPIGIEHLQEEFFGDGYETLIFSSRRDAVKFVKLCNDKINDYKKSSNFYRPMEVKLLNVNDFYKS